MCGTPHVMCWQNKDGLEAGAPVANGAGTLSAPSPASSQAMRQASPRAKEHGSRTPRTRSPSRSPAIVITEGQDVEILDPETGVYARALVVTILPTGDLDVHMADGSTRSCVDLNLVRPIASASPPRPHRSSISKETPTPSKQEAPKPTPSEVAPETTASAPAIPWAVGTRVEARYRGGEEWRAAVVDGVDVGHNTADVTYEHDGSKDWKVRPNDIGLNGVLGRGGWGEGRRAGGRRG